MLPKRIFEFSVVAVVAILAMASPGSAQQLNASMQPYENPRAPAAVVMPLESDGTATAFAQRFSLALVAGLGVGGLTSLVNDSRSAISFGYTAGAITGTLLAARKTGGAKPLPTIIGALIGALPLVWAVQEESQLDGALGANMLSTLGAITVPLGAVTGSMIK